MIYSLHEHTFLQAFNFSVNFSLNFTTGFVLLNITLDDSCLSQKFERASSQLLR